MEAKERNPKTPGKVWKAGDDTAQRLPSHFSPNCPGFESLRSLDLSLGTAWSVDPCSTEQQSLQIHLGAKQERIGHHHHCLRSELLPLGGSIGPGCIRHCKT